MILSGHFTLGFFIKLFLTVWFGFALFWIGSTVRSVVAGQLPWWMPFFGMGMLVVGFVHVLIGKWWARPDIPWLSRLIQDALSEGMTGIAEGVREL